MRRPLKTPPIFFPLSLPKERVVVVGYKKFYTLDQNGQETQGLLGDGDTRVPRRPPEIRSHFAARCKVGRILLGLGIYDIQ
jgi:hypothetical protein